MNLKNAFLNPNSIIREHIVILYNEALKNAIYSVDSVESIFKKYMDDIKAQDEKLYEVIIEVLYTDYVVSSVLMDDEEKNSSIGFVKDKDELFSLVSKDKYILSDMASSTKNREIDLSHLYSSMYNIDYIEKKGLFNVSKCIIYDYVESHYPYIITKVHNNLSANTFTKDSYAKNVALLDLLNEIKIHEEDDYKKVLYYYLEIYYKFKKYAIEFLDVIPTHKERILLKLLDDCNLSGAITLVSRDDDLLKLVLNEYSNNCFDRNTKYKNEVENYYLYFKRREKLDNIFRKKENNNE